METIELGGRSGQEVYEELKHRLEGMGYLPDEYFLLDAGWKDGKVIPPECGPLLHHGLRGQRGDLPGRAPDMVW